MTAVQLPPIPKFTGQGGAIPETIGDWNSLWLWFAQVRNQLGNLLTTFQNTIASHTGTKVAHGYLGTIANTEGNPGTMARDTYAIYQNLANGYRYWVWCDGDNRYGAGIDPLTGTAHTIMWAGVS